MSQEHTRPFRHEDQSGSARRPFRSADAVEKKRTTGNATLAAVLAALVAAVASMGYVTTSHARDATRLAASAVPPAHVHESLVKCAEKVDSAAAGRVQVAPLRAKQPSLRGESAWPVVDVSLRDPAAMRRLHFYMGQYTPLPEFDSTSGVRVTSIHTVSAVWLDEPVARQFRFNVEFKLMHESGLCLWLAGPGYGNCDRLGYYVEIPTAGSLEGRIRRQGVQLFAFHLPHALDEAAWHAASFCRDGGRLMLFVDGELAADCTDPDPLSGALHARCAFGCYRSSFDTGIRVRRVELRSAPPSPGQQNQAACVFLPPSSVRPSANKECLVSAKGKDLLSDQWVRSRPEFFHAVGEDLVISGGNCDANLWYKNPIEGDFAFEVVMQYVGPKVPCPTGPFASEGERYVACGGSATNLRLIVAHYPSPPDIGPGWPDPSRFKLPLAAWRAALPDGGGINTLEWLSKQKSATLDSTANFAPATDRKHTVRLERLGNQARLFLDGNLLLKGEHPLPSLEARLPPYVGLHIWLQGAIIHSAAIYRLPATRLSDHEQRQLALLKEPHNDVPAPAPIPETTAGRPPSNSARAKALKPLAWYHFDGNANDEMNPAGTAELKNVEFRGGAIYVNGKSPFDGTGQGNTILLTTKPIDFTAFTVAARIKPERFARNEYGRVAVNPFSGPNILLAAGPSYRWFILSRSDAGILGVQLNQGAYLHDFQDTAIPKDQWTTVACGIDLKAGKCVAYLNGKKAGESVVPAGFKLNNGGTTTTTWSFTDYGSGHVFKGLVDELIVYDRLLSPKEFETIPIPVDQAPPHATGGRSTGETAVRREAVPPQPSAGNPLANTVPRAAQREPLTPEQEQRLRKATELDGKIDQLYWAGRSREALPLAQEALKIRREILGMEHNDSVFSLDSLAWLHSVRHEFSQTEPLFRQALEIRKKVLGETHPDYTASLDNMVSRYETLTQYAMAEPLCRQALNIRKKILGETHPVYISNLNRLASLYTSMRDYAKAEPLYIQALEICKKSLGETHRSYVQSLNNLAGLYWHQRDYPRAEPLYLQALEIEKRRLGEDPYSYACSLADLGSCYKETGDYTKAEPLLRQALEIKKRTCGENNALAYVITLTDLGSCYKETSDYTKAEPLLRQAFDICKKAYGEKSSACEDCLKNLISLYLAQGEYSRAVPLLLQDRPKNSPANNVAPAVQPAKPKPLTPEQEAKRRRDVEELDKQVREQLHDRDKSREALPVAQVALKIRQQVLGKEDYDTAFRLISLAARYDALGEYAKAEPLYRQGVEIHTAAWPILWLPAQYDYARVKPLLLQACDIRRKALGENHPDYASSLHGLATLCVPMNEYDEAEQLYRQAIYIRMNVFGEMHPDCATGLHDLAGLYMAKRDYAKAELLYLGACGIRRKILGENHPDYATSLHDLARLYDSMGKYAKAEPLYVQACDIRRKILGENHPAYATSLHDLAALYDSMDKYAKAEPLYLQACAIRKKVLADTHPDFETTLERLTALYVSMGDYAKAEPFYLQACEIRKKVAEIRRKALGETNPADGATSSNPEELMTFPVIARDPVLDAKLAMRKPLTSEQEQRLREAEELDKKTQQLYWAGRSREALPLAQGAFEIRQQVLGPEDLATGRSLYQLGKQYDALGEYAKAEQLYLQDLEIQKKVYGENHNYYTSRLSVRAAQYEIRGDYARAEPLVRQLLEIEKKNNFHIANTLDRLASLYEKQGDYLRAEQLFRQALEIRKKDLREGDAYTETSYARSLNNLGCLYQAQGDYLRAEPLLRQALEIRKKVLDKDHFIYEGIQYAESLMSMAKLYGAQGDHARAEPMYRQALHIQGIHGIEYAKGLNSVAGLYWAQADYSRAAPLFRLALDVDKENLGENHPDYAQSLNHLAYVYQAQGDYASAEPLLRQAVTIMRKQLEATAVIQSERQQLAMLQDNRHYLDGYLRLAADSGQYAEPAYRELLAWKGMVLRRNRLARAATQSPELAATFMRLQRVATQLTHLAWATPDPGREANWREQVEKLSAEKEQIEAELSARSAEYRQAKQAVPLEDIQAALSKDSVLVDFVEYTRARRVDKQAKTKAAPERRLLAFIVAPDRPVEMVALGAVQPINEAIETWRVTFGMSAEGAKAAMLLRERLWAPIEGKLQGAKIVLLSPDGALSRLPFGALPGKTPGSYLIEERTFAVVPVPQLIPQLVQEAGRKQLRKKLLLLGNVDYDTSPAKGRIGFQPVAKDSSNEKADVARADVLRSTFRSVPAGVLHFGPLPGTEGEIAAIEELYRHEFGSAGVIALRKSQAGKQAFLAEARQYGYLHLATHGFFLEERVRPPASGSRAASPIREMFQGPEAGATYPALLSGLALAGANRAGEHEPSPPAPLPEGEGSKLSSRPAPLPKLEGSKSSSPLAPLPSAGEGSKLTSPPAILPEGEGSEGILTAEEIGTQNLDGVQIVVLSACESGLGKQTSGEGLLGLQRSFQSAGARSVVASLWSVDDAATKTLMVAFYTNLWEKKMPKLAALRQAQLTMLREYDSKAGTLRGPGGERPVDPDKLAAAKEIGGANSLSPFYWASFVLSGDWK